MFLKSSAKHLTNVLSLAILLLIFLTSTTASAQDSGKVCVPRADLKKSEKEFDELKQSLKETTESLVLVRGQRERCQGHNIELTNDIREQDYEIESLMIERDELRDQVLLLQPKKPRPLIHISRWITSVALAVSTTACFERCSSPVTWSLAGASILSIAFNVVLEFYR